MAENFVVYRGKYNNININIDTNINFDININTNTKLCIKVY